MEQVKGVYYRLEAFLGPGELTNMGHTAIAPHVTSSEKTLGKESESETVSDTQLYHIVMYLGPGDCHHFHSPADWTPQLCRHVPGETIGTDTPRA